MKVRMVKGLAVVLCAAMLAPAAGAAGAVMMPGMVVEATGSEKPDTENNGTNSGTTDPAKELSDKKTEAKNDLDDWKKNNVKEGDSRAEKINTLIQ